MSTTRFYKIARGTATFEAVETMIETIRAAQKVSDDLAEELGCDRGKVLSDSHYVAGGIVGFKINEMPEGWKKVHAKTHFGFYFPKATVKSNQKLLQRIYNLPKIRRSDLSQLVGYKSFFGAPGIKPCGDIILVEMTSGGWGDKSEPTEDMVEITGSEFDEISKLELAAK